MVCSRPRQIETSLAFCVRDREHGCGHWYVWQLLLELKGLEIQAMQESGQALCTRLRAVVAKLERDRSQWFNPNILLYTTLSTRQREEIGCGGKQRKKSQTLSLLRKKTIFVCRICLFCYIVPSKRSVKAAFRVLIPPGVWNITADAKVTFVLSSSEALVQAQTEWCSSSLSSINTNNNRDFLQWFHLNYKEWR